MQDAHHQDGRFLVPRKDDAPDVGVVPPVYVEPLEDEIAELASGHCRRFVERTTNLAALVAFGQAVVELVERRGGDDVTDFSRPVVIEATTKAELDPEEKRRMVAAELGRVLDWICQGQPVLGMGVRAAVVASHIRRSAINGRTDQQIALEIGNDSRASVNKTKADFRRSFDADYPGENGKSTDTKRKCKTSRITKLQVVK